MEGKEIPCPACDGAHAYWIIGDAGTQVPARGDVPMDAQISGDIEIVDPCDECHGEGWVVTDADDPTYNDVHGYEAGHWADG